MKKNVINCSIQRALGEVGERWSLLIIREAVMGSTRFDEFQERLGIARNILADRLLTLVAHGIMTRSLSPESARVHLYRLTPKGHALLPVLAALMQWGDHYIHADIGPPILLVEQKTGTPIRDLALTARDGRPLKPDDIEIKAGPGATQAMRQRLATR